ncbi:CaiB/BaiF CoA transferase family protein [Sphingomonas bacterium]|uniref:CaiB/BaiF CoA transferase family protein n=1 Tax=Sphingomonas bacterium TaxID=1895847 RepID=UPI001575F6F5|nr:CaiB/BaiF CoA-transferase family protein [Sphingomonas bacterium]
MTERARTGPLAGIRVVEFAGIGPGPHCAMLLSDMGAEVLRIDRAGGNGWPNPVVDRGRHRLELDIRSEEGRAGALAAISNADVLVEGYRPGVMERLGYGPDEMLAVNPRLIYGRMTGWGQTGPLAQAAGHDINYIALTGALHAIANDEGRPVPPLNLVGDFGGGSLYLALGIAAALVERGRSGQGQVVDAAIVDGVASLMTMFGGLLPFGAITLDPERNLLGGRAPFYRCYECEDGKYVSVGPLEPHFYADLLQRVDASEDLRKRQNDPSNWRERADALAAIFRTRPRDAWCELLDGTDACFAPVLAYEESLEHPHMTERGTYIEADGLRQAAPAPRFSRTPGDIGASGDGRALLDRWTAA